MDCCQNVSVPGGLPSNCGKQDQEVSQFGLQLGTLDDMFSNHSSEGDVALEWLSTYVEDCLTSTGNCLPPETPTSIREAASTATAACRGLKSLQSEKIQDDISGSLLARTVIPGKARSKRKRCSLANRFHRLNQDDQTFQLTGSDPPLLQQAYWLADSELIKPVIEENKNNTEKTMDRKQGQAAEGAARRVRFGCLEESNGQLPPQPRRCTHCLAQRTPQWRAGPLGPKTLCNACGVRYKSGRLLPEYRPAKSPTFVSYKHSNSHKRVMEMRMSLLSSNS